LKSDGGNAFVGRLWSLVSEKIVLDVSGGTTGLLQVTKTDFMKQHGKLYRKGITADPKNVRETFLGVPCHHALTDIFQLSIQVKGLDIRDAYQYLVEFSQLTPIKAPYHDSTANMAAAHHNEEIELHGGAIASIVSSLYIIARASTVLSEKNPPILLETAVLAVQTYNGKKNGINQDVNFSSGDLSGLSDEQAATYAQNFIKGHRGRAPMVIKRLVEVFMSEAWCLDFTFHWGVAATFHVSIVDVEEECKDEENIGAFLLFPEMVPQELVGLETAPLNKIMGEQMDCPLRTSTGRGHIPYMPFGGLLPLQATNLESYFKWKDGKLDGCFETDNSDDDPSNNGHESEEDDGGGAEIDTDDCEEADKITPTQAGGRSCSIYLTKCQRYLPDLR
jgi:hypothetical protein